jgi:hypothetical protein
MAKTTGPKPKPGTPAEVETTDAPQSAPKKKKDDGFKEIEGGNKIFEEWRGEIKIETDRKGKVIRKWFNPLVKQHGRRKITENEAAALNQNAAHSPRMDYVIMYMEPGTTQSGQQQDVSEIVPDAVEGAE